MTEVEWLTGTDPAPMLTFLRGRASERKLRLFAVACCRRCWHLLADERSRDSVCVTERYADGLESKAALKRARQSVRAARYDLPTGGDRLHGTWGAYWLVEVAATENAFAMLADEMQRLVRQGILDLGTEGQSSQCALLRDIFGPLLFRPVTIEPADLTPEVVELAGAIYEGRAFDRLPELADALKWAGCTDADILDRCRSQAEHVRGCWVLDALLGKG